MISISVAHNEARLTATRDFIDLGTPNGKLQIFGNTRPVLNGGAAGAPPLVEIVLDKPCGVVSANSLALDSSDLPLITVSGAPTWARIINGNGAHVLDCDAGGPGATTEVVVSEATLFEGGQVALVSATLG
jgi:hypothetical protein